MPRYNGECWHKQIDPIMTVSGTYQPGMCRDCHVLIDMRTGKRMNVRDVQNWSIEIVYERIEKIETKIVGG